MASSGDSSPRGKCQFVKEEVIASAKWLNLNKITYKDAKGNERFWEAAGRTTKPSSAAADAVAVIGVLRRTLKYDSVVCIKQYRPPMKTYTIEFPAGLIDAGETAEQAALRELKEETGYVAKIKHISPATALDPGAGNTTLIMASAVINGDAPVNLHPKQQLEETEDIEVILLPVDNLVERLNEFAAEGMVVDSRLFSYAVALAHARIGDPKEIVEDTA